MTMRRRDLLILLAAMAAVVWPPAAARAQRAAPALPVIGFLNSGSPEPYAPFVAAFRAGLKDSGYTEGENVAIEFRWAEGRYDRLPALAEELVGRRAAVIAATGGSVSARAAKAATSTIPIVFTTGGDPVKQGLVASLSRPGGNATGVNLITTELMPKRLELLRDLVPRATAIALLTNPDNPNIKPDLTALEAAARTTGLQLQIAEARTEDELDQAFATLARQRPGALLVAADPFFNSRRDQLVALAGRHAIPAIYEWPEFVAAGGLISYGPSLADAYRQVGAYVGKILAGAKPAELPVQQPTRFELVINVKAAEALGLAVPQSILDRADEVIE